jgi:hypothetical protein
MSDVDERSVSLVQTVKEMEFEGIGRSGGGRI